MALNEIRRPTLAGQHTPVGVSEDSMMPSTEMRAEVVAGLAVDDGTPAPTLAPAVVRVTPVAQYGRDLLTHPALTGEDPDENADDLTDPAEGEDVMVSPFGEVPFDEQAAQEAERAAMALAFGEDPDEAEPAEDEIDAAIEKRIRKRGTNRGSHPMVTDRDEELMLHMARFLYLTAPLAWYGVWNKVSPESTAYQGLQTRLTNLHKLKLVEKIQDGRPHGVPTLWALSREGYARFADQLDLEYAKGVDANSQVYHRLSVADVMLNRYVYEDTTVSVITEREIASEKWLRWQKFTAAQKEYKTAVSLWKSRSFHEAKGAVGSAPVEPTLVIPDTVAVGSDGSTHAPDAIVVRQGTYGTVRVAVEVELTRKSREKLGKIFAQYTYSNKVAVQGGAEGLPWEVLDYWIPTSSRDGDQVEKLVSDTFAEFVGSLSEKDRTHYAPKLRVFRFTPVYAAQPRVPARKAA